MSNLRHLIFAPDRCSATHPGVHQRLNVVQCECDTIGVDHDAVDEEARAALAEQIECDVSELEHVSACTCGQPICDDCWADACPHNEKETTMENLQPNRNADGWHVTDVNNGGVWWPSDEAKQQIEAAQDPAAEALRIVRAEPMRGVWRS